MNMSEEMLDDKLDDAQIAEKIRANPPSCVAGFNLLTELPVAWDDSFKLVFSLECKCGSHIGKVLGYPLSDYNFSYDGDEFVTPIAFHCGQCNTVTEILDTAIHGYHAELAKVEGGVGSAKIRGNGVRSEYVCPNCENKTFKVTVSFIYWDFDIMYDEPDWAGQEFFNVFLIYGHCQNCDHVSPIADLGKL
jgi:hypothetical protein